MKAYDFDCPIEAAFEVLGGKWKASCIYYLRDGALRFSELQELLETISAKVLTNQLKDLELHGIVERKVMNESPPKVFYSLTDYGKSTLSVIDKVCEWGEVHMERMGKTAVYN